MELTMPWPFHDHTTWNPWCPWNNGSIKESITEFSKYVCTSSIPGNDDERFIYCKKIDLVVWQLTLWHFKVDTEKRYWIYSVQWINAVLHLVMWYMEFAWLFTSRVWVWSAGVHKNSTKIVILLLNFLESTWSPLGVCWKLIWSPIINVYCIGLHNFIVHHSIEKPTIISPASITAYHPSITPTTLSIMVKVK